MSQTKRVGSLEIGEDLQFQQKEWKVERAGWVVMAGVILLALLGLFGYGPISRTTQSSPDGFQISYERFDRQMNPSLLSLQLPTEATREGQARFRIDRQYLEKVQIENISPEPDGVEVSSEWMIYTIKVADPSQPVTVELDIVVEESSLIQGRAGWDEAAQVSFSQFVFP